MLPSEDPVLAGVWPEMTATERLRLQLMEGEPVPAEVSETVRQMYVDRHRTT